MACIVLASPDRKRSDFLFFDPDGRTDHSVRLVEGSWDHDCAE